ncbi:MAG: hypothetical protein U0V87_03815 [Acidobacteriota bacterium]
MIKPAPAMEEKYQSDPVLDVLRLRPAAVSGRSDARRSRSVKTPLTIVRRHDGSLVDCDQGDMACTAGRGDRATLWFARVLGGRPEARSRE